jgi:predicted transcriptional regulator
MIFDMSDFYDWQTKQMKDPEFTRAIEEIETGYQVARLRIARGLTQAQLAEMVGTQQPSIARLENGKSAPTLPFLKRIANALNAKIEVRIQPL